MRDTTTFPAFLQQGFADLCKILVNFICSLRSCGIYVSFKIPPCFYPAGRHNFLDNHRRKTELACTEKAQSIIEQGRRMQDDFIRRLMAGLEEEKLEIFFEVIDTMNENLDAILEGEE